MLNLHHAMGDTASHVQALESARQNAEETNLPNAEDHNAARAKHEQDAAFWQGYTYVPEDECSHDSALSAQAPRNDKYSYVY